MSSTDRMEYEMKPGKWRLLGLPIILCGLGLALSPFLGEGLRLLLVFSVPFGGLLALMGIWLAFGREGWILDRNSQTVLNWSTVFGYRAENKRELGSFKELSITKEVRGHHRHRFTCYPVQLHGEENKFEFSDPRNHQAARAYAERVARFLEMGIHDRSSEKGTVYRPLEELDTTLMERYKSASESMEMPPSRASAKSKLKVEDDSLVFKIPGNSKTSAILQCLLLAAILVGPLLPFKDEIMASSEAIPVLLMISSVLVWVGYDIVTQTWSNTLDISKHGVKLKRGWKQNLIPLEQLEEFEISENGLAARSDRESLEIVCDLSKRELKWVRDTLHWFIASLARQS